MICSALDICSNVVSCIKIDLFKHCTVSPGEDFYKRMKRSGAEGLGGGGVFRGGRGRTRHAALIWFHLDSGPSPAALSEDSICVTRYILRSDVSALMMIHSFLKAVRCSVQLLVPQTQSPAASPARHQLQSQTFDMKTNLLAGL